MATFVESFVYPLVLLLIGAGITIGVTSLLIPWFAKKSENRKKELEIKVDIVSKMAEINGSALAKAAFLYLRKKAISTAAEKEAAYEDAKKIITDASNVVTLLKSYSSEKNIIKAWKNYVTVLVLFGIASSLYFYKDPSEDEKSFLENSLEAIKRYFSDNNLTGFSDDYKIKLERLTTDMTFDFDLWDKARSKIEDQGNKIIEDFLKSDIRIS